MAGDFLTFAKRVPFFRTLSPQDLEYLEPAVTYYELEQTQVLYRPGGRPDALYVIESGSFEVSVPGRGGIEVRLAEMGAGTVVGELALAEKKPRSELVRALEESTVYKIDAQYYWELRDQYDPLAFKLLRAVGHRINGRLRETGEAYGRMTDDEYDALTPGKYETKGKKGFLKKFFGKGKL